MTFDRPPAPRSRTGAGVGLGGSLLLHASIAAYVAMTASTPTLDLEFQFPSEVEFGLTEGMTVESGLPGGEPQQPAEAPEPSPQPPEAEEGLTVVDAGVQRPERRDAGAPAPRDAGAPDAGTAPDPVASAEDTAGDREGEGEEERAGGEGTGRTELPPGAQIAMRIDMARIRRSPLADEVRELLAQIPDWQIVLSGSGLEPVDDLDRLLIASPNLQRSRMLLAGRHEGDADTVRAIVARMAAARGEQAAWRIEHGVPVAPWPDEDDTERVVALVGPRHFTITRPEDLPRLLAVARVRAEEAREEGEEGEPGAEEAGAAGADALLSMPEGAALTLEVEGVRQFVRGPRGVPARARLVVTERPGGGAEVLVEGTYDTTEQASEAQAFWDRAREAYAGNLLLAAIGMDSTLRDMELEAEGEVLTARTVLSAPQLRLLLGYARGMLRDQARRREGDDRAPPSSPRVPRPSSPPPR